MSWLIQQPIFSTINALSSPSAAVSCPFYMALLTLPLLNTLPYVVIKVSSYSCLKHKSRMYEHMNKSASTWASFNNSNKSNLSYRTHQVETSWSLLLALELFNHHTRFEKPAVPIRGRH